jgi:hypothetical protein
MTSRQGQWRYRSLYACAAMAVLGTVFAPIAAAQCRQFLYFSKFPVFADNEPTCYSRVTAAMTQSGFSGIHHNSLEVAGSKGSVYVSVTCVNTQPRTTAVVMAVGGNEAETMRVRDEIATKIAKTQGF